MTCALLLIDFQADFASPDGAMACAGRDLSTVAAALAQATRLADAARAAKLPVIFVRLDGPPGLCAPGTPGAAFTGPQPLPGETVAAKTRFSALANGLGDDLKAQGIQTLILAGLTTECCVAATAWNAMERGFDIVIAADACAAYAPDLHSVTLKALGLSGAAIRTVAELEREWNGDRT